MLCWNHAFQHAITTNVQKVQPKLIAQHLAVELYQLVKRIVHQLAQPIASQIQLLQNVNLNADQVNHRVQPLAVIATKHVLLIQQTQAARMIVKEQLLHVKLNVRENAEIISVEND